MNVNTPAYQRPIEAPLAPQQAGPIRNVRSSNEGDRVDQARKRFLDEGEEQFRSGHLSAKGHALVKAAVNPGKAGAPGVQVSTFAVNGFQSPDMLMIKRVPPLAEGPNFVVYMPEDEFTSFHEFNTSEEMTEWIKEVARDPTERSRFAQHFANTRSPEQQGRVEQSLAEFADDKPNVVVGRFAIVKGDIFERLDKDVIPFEGLREWQYVGVGPTGNPIFQGRRPDRTLVLYSFDAYGNLLGSSGKDEFYFVQNGLNENNALVPMTRNQFLRKVVSTTLDNSGANDLRGILDEFVKQLRNPGHGLGAALIALGVPEDIAHSIEKIVKNPIKGTLLELNHDNRLGKIFGLDKEAMDNHLEIIGGQIQSNIPYYGKWRDGMDTGADVIEGVAGPYEEPTTEVTT
ncbi:hypothetical protein C4K03_3277 [Pseudomonas synxantha]|uniref:Dermonecrotic toxin N-terminal domain-containing protein n=1 Tax=Pseudomonas synxantha TaxID=47883 RepID=A0A3G7U9X6_9PSED|nr:DUF6543 domain-containing protein [Pseudomonas synxantha]AZE55432.1 hypothetical protein C4K03_3277 [Pseudomonas synxantha]